MRNGFDNKILRVKIGRVSASVDREMAGMRYRMHVHELYFSFIASEVQTLYFYR